MPDKIVNHFVLADGSTAKYSAEQLAGDIPEVVDIRTGYDGTVYPSAGDAVRVQCTTLNNGLNMIGSKALINGAKDVTNIGYYSSSGEVLVNESWRYSEEYIEINPNKQYSMWYANSNVSFGNITSNGVVFYDWDKKVIERQANKTVFTPPSNAKYARIYVNASYINNVMFVEGNSEPFSFAPFGYDIKTVYENNMSDNYADAFETILNMFNYLNIENYSKALTFENIDTVEHIGEYVTASQKVNTSSVWAYYEADVKGGNLYYYSGRNSGACYALMIFDKHGRCIKTIPTSLDSPDARHGVIAMPIDADHAILNTNNEVVAELKEIKSISFNEGGDNSTPNYLYGKKLYCGGDSITEAVNVGTFDDNIKKSYAGFVAERNNMIYVSDGVGGSTMGNVIIDGWNHNAFCVTRYLNIPTDADFITLWFGWNDSAYGWKSMRDAYCVSTYGSYYSQLTETQKTEVDTYRTWRQWLSDYVGTVDSTSDKTWCGAWSKVLAWLLDNCPSSKIGVVVAYGMHTEMETALVSVCEKYGISYVKAYDPHEFFSVGHSLNIGAEQATKRKTLYTLDNTHPNELGYAMMSDSYEQFLRRI